MSVSIKPKSLPLVLYPPKKMSVLEISVSAFPSQVFRLWIAEIIKINDQNQMYNQAHVGEQDWSVDSTGSIFECHVTETGPLRVDARVLVRENELEIKYKLKNLSNSIQRNITPGTCYQLAKAPDFLDQEGDRTYAWVNKRLASIGLEGKRAECHDHHNPNKSSFLSMEDKEKGIGVIGVEAQTGGSTVMGWETHKGYSGNTDPALCCLHSNGVVESLEPGESVTLHGWLGWSLDPVNLLFDQAIKKLKSRLIK